MKKTALASAIALALISASGTSVWAVTTTVGGTVISDRDEVAAGGIVNLALLGLDAQGAVDKQSGSMIMVTVKSDQCDIVGGSSSPTGEPTTTPDSNRLGEGQFASATRYVTLDQGNGKVFLQCPPSARGTETIEVSFQEKIPVSGGGFEFKNITSPMTKEITITPPVTDPGGLNIKSFKPTPSDPRGKMDCTPSGIMGDTCTEPDNGIWGEMTAGVAGGQIEVWAQNQQAAGEITVTVTHTTEMPELKQTYKAEMVQGRAMVTLDSAITKAGEYYIEATMKGFDGNSVRSVYADKLKVWSTGVPAGLKLWSAKNRIAKADFTAFPFPDNQISQGATVQAQLLDAFGNATTPCAPAKDLATGMTTCTMTPMDINLSIQDSKGVASNSALNLYIPAGSPDGKAIARTNDLILGNQKDELLTPVATTPVSTTPGTTPVVTTTVSTTSLVATASGANGTPIGSIAASNPLEIMVVPTSLGVTVQPAFLEDHLAGEEFEAIMVKVLNNKGQLHVDANNNPIRPQGDIAIRNLYTGEESSAYPDSNNVVRALFKKATDDHGEYLVYDRAGNYGQIWIQAGAITAAAATQAEFHNAHGQVLTDIVPTQITPDKKYYTLLPEVAFVLEDEWGNPETPIGAATTGFVFGESSNGQVLYNTREGTHGIPGRLEFFDNSGIPSLIAIRYDAMGANQFAGQDAISLNFTKPGKKNLTLTTTIPAYQGLVKIESYLDEDTIPVNSEVALTVETLDDKDNLFVEPDPNQPTNVKLTVNGQAADNITPKSVTEIQWKEKQLTEMECQTVGGTFTNGLCTTMQALTAEQCQLIKGALMNDRCMQMTTMPVVSGQTLNFSDTGGRKVFVVSAGANEGQFSLTFDAMGTPTTPVPSVPVTTTRTIKVGQTVPDCVKDPTTCQNEQACENTQSIWSDNQCFLGNEIVSADTTNPNYPDPKNEGDASFKGGIRNLTQNGEIFDPKPTQPITLGDKVGVACNIKVDEEHQGKPADILVAAVHLPVAGKDPVYPKGYEWYMVRHCREVQGENSPCPSIGWIPDVLPSDAQGNPYLPALEPLESVANLPKYYTVRAYVGNIPYVGEYQAYCGYMMTEGKDKGKIIYNGDPIDFNVVENK
ncbi:hypothetical protein THII_1864 [Thioploca ingrica]|uniref:Uncharacterized protein n=1 Tax=Thioploca ingrica TaxID=40754 RepID=A0A090BV34_9GAMM|nr:hypothetical protein THII_1864 [Thioploca ingrica]